MYRFLLKDISNDQLREFLLGKIIKQKANDLILFMKLVQACAKNAELGQKLEFLFDVFSGFNETMDKK